LLVGREHSGGMIYPPQVFMPIPIGMDMSLFQIPHWGPV
jgi:hypothetical protein